MLDYSHFKAGDLVSIKGSVYDENIRHLGLIIKITGKEPYSTVAKIHWVENHNDAFQTNIPLYRLRKESVV